MANLSDVQAMVLKPTAHLLYMAAHLALKHGEGNSPLRWFYDIHLLVEREGQRIQWDELVARAREFGWAPALHVALAGTVARFATPLRIGLLESLVNVGDPRDQALIQRKTRSQTRWESTSDALASLSWRARLHLLMALAIPSPAYVRWRYKPRLVLSRVEGPARPNPLGFIPSSRHGIVIDPLAHIGEYAGLAALLHRALRVR